MTSCVTRRQAILTAFTNRWILSAGRRPTPPVSSFSRQHPILTTPAARSYSSRGMSYGSFLGITVVPENTVLVIERLGVHRKILSQPGMHFVVPFLDRVAFVHDIGDRYLRLHLCARTKDSFRMFFNIALRVKTVDVLLASYNAPYADHISATNTIATIALHRRVSTLTVENIFSESGALRDALLLDIAPVMETWGIKCQDYHLSIISYQRLHLESKFWWRKICDSALDPQLHDLAVTRDESTSIEPI